MATITNDKLTLTIDERGTSQAYTTRRAVSSSSTRQSISSGSYSRTNASRKTASTGAGRNIRSPLTEAPSPCRHRS